MAEFICCGGQDGWGQGWDEYHTQTMMPALMLWKRQSGPVQVSMLSIAHLFWNCTILTSIMPLIRLIVAC
eukprot:scaffold181604_cov18-Tisochrysis_lutea.AAC.2